MSKIYTTHNHVCHVSSVCLEIMLQIVFQIEIFMGYDFTAGRFFDFPMIFAWALQQCSANVVVVIA